MLAEGKKAPAFKLKGIDKKGKEIENSLKDILAEGKKTVLYFYPRDNTPGCTTEACDFKENMSRLCRKAVVVGVSPDTVEKHQKFMKDFGLNFSLLCDPDKKMMEKYEAFGEKTMYGKKTMGVIRTTYILDDKGKILKGWTNVRAKGHVEKVMEALNDL